MNLFKKTFSVSQIILVNFVFCIGYFIGGLILNDYSGLKEVTISVILLSVLFLLCPSKEDDDGFKN